MMIASRKDTLAIWLLTAVMICGVLFFGLRPKSGKVVENGARWVSEHQVLQFAQPGIAYINNLEIGDGTDHVESFSLEICLRPYSIEKEGFRPVVMFHNGRDGEQLIIWQWGSSLIAMNGDDYDYKRKNPRITATQVLKPGKLSLVTLTVSSLGTKIYFDGELKEYHSGWMLHMPDEAGTRRLVLGNSIYGKNGWKGEIRGLTIFNKTLTAEEVEASIGQWLTSSGRKWEKNDDIWLAADFARNPEHTFRDGNGGNFFLQIPPYIETLQPSFFKISRSQLTFRRILWSDVLLNIFGFIPLGMFLCLGLIKTANFSPAKAMIFTIVFCFLLSLGIETAQAWMVSRASSYIDLGCNTMGAGLGGVFSRMVDIRFIQTSN